MLRLRHLRPGQRFMLVRDRRRFTCYGRHPERPYRWMVEPPEANHPQSKTLYGSCYVKLIWRVDP